VITGASSGVGRAIALGLASRGAFVCLIGRSPERLAGVAEEIAARGGRASTCTADLTSDRAIQDVVERLRRDHGGVEILVHSAGVFARGRIGEAPLEELDAQYRTNLRAPYALTAGLLIYLGIDAIHEALEISQNVGGPFCHPGFRRHGKA